MLSGIDRDGSRRARVLAFAFYAGIAWLASSASPLLWWFVEWVTGSS